MRPRREKEKGDPEKQYGIGNLEGNKTVKKTVSGGVRENWAVKMRTIWR